MKLSTLLFCTPSLFLLACTPPICGDGEVDAELNEDCDDGATVDGDGCSADCTFQTLVTMDDVNGANAGGAFFAIFADQVVPTDFDGDGVNDFDVSSLNIIVSDQADLCDQIAADPGAVGNLPDIQAVSAFVIEIDALGAGALEAGTFTSNDTLLNVLLTPAEGQVFVEGTANIRQGGVDIVASTGIGLADLAQQGSGTLDLTEFTAGASLTADFNVTLAADTADPNTFDTDPDGDGTNDFLAVNADLSASLINLSFCAALLQ